jgi:hypothetical protein
MGPSVAQRWQNWRYFVCDKPVYLLVDISGSQLIDQRANDTGTMFQVWFFMTTPDFSGFACRSYSHKDGKLADEWKITDAEMNAMPPAWVSIPYTVLYQGGRWWIAGVEGFEQYRVPSYKAFLQRLMLKG